MSLERRDRQSKAALGTLPLQEHIVSNLRDSFAGFKWRRDMWIGMGLGIARALLQSWGKDSEDRLWTGLTYIVPVFLFLIGDALWKTIRAFYRLYRERKHIAFREPVDTIMVIIAGWCFIAALCLWIGYVSSPHLKAWLGDVGARGKVKYHLTIGEATRFPTPNTAIFFEKISVENSGVPSTARNWSLQVKLPDGEKLKGFPLLHSGSIWALPDSAKGSNLYVNNKTVYGPELSIFSRTEFNPTVKGKPVSGFAEFIVVGTRKEIIREVGTELKVVFEDRMGHENSVLQKVDAIEWTVMPPS